MGEEMLILQDVSARLKAIAEARLLRSMLEGAIRQLQEAKEKAASAAPGTPAEHQYLKEASEASERVAQIQAKLFAAERILRQTAYLLTVLSE